MDALAPGDPVQIGPYRIIGRLGAGGMGRVYLARSEGGRTVAVKAVHDGFAQNREFRLRFAQEVAAARKIGGAWIAPVLDADTDGSVPWVATGYIPGPDLHEVIVRGHGPLPHDSVLTLANGLAHALVDIHGAGMVHRDLKPSNILVTADGPRVIDFGIARALETPVDGFLTRTGAVIGSPGFMSPEQVRGERLTPASDVFCLGTVLAYAATGRTPFGDLTSGAHALMFRIAEEKPDLTGLRPPLEDLVRDCLRKDPARRLSTTELLARTQAWAVGAVPAWLPGPLLASLGSQAGRLLDADAPALADTTPAEPAPAPTPTKRTPLPTPPPQPAPRPSRRRVTIVTALAVVLLATATAVIVPQLGKKNAGGAKDHPTTTTASPSLKPVNSAAFVGTWVGQAQGDERKTTPRRVQFEIDKGTPSTGNTADYVLQYRERSCLGTAKALAVQNGRTAFSFEGREFSEGDPSCSLPQTLSVQGDALLWRHGDASILLSRQPEPTAELDDVFGGGWTTTDTRPSMTIENLRARPNSIVDIGGGTGDSYCPLATVVVTVAPDHLVLGEVSPPAGPDMGICYGHGTFDIRPAGKDRLRVTTNRGVPYLFTRTKT
ncbi:serine/threonine-protein kinase [Streptomyces sp. NPDC053513]|uniref:serine/threonine-protein kinase n=1 Tax=unclassified Streptomyces TaxID=2593676 RepID=UPI0037D61A3B